jgi:hypothetical protein
MPVGTVEVVFQARVAATLLCIATVIATGCGDTSAATTSQAGTTACTSAAIGQTSASLQGGTGNAVGEFRLVNRGNAACVLRGAPAVTFLTAAGNALPVRNIGRTAQATKKLVVHPGAAAVSDLQWGNGCHLPANAARVELAWPGGTAVAPLSGANMPRCDAPGMKSHVAASAFSAG